MSTAKHIAGKLSVYYNTTLFNNVSWEFDKFRTGIHLCKLRTAPVARF